MKIRYDSFTFAEVGSIVGVYVGFDVGCRPQMMHVRIKYSEESSQFGSDMIFTLAVVGSFVGFSVG